jgi:hypothetical protein
LRLSADGYREAVAEQFAVPVVRIVYPQAKTVIQERVFVHVHGAGRVDVGIDECSELGDIICRNSDVFVGVVRFRQRCPVGTQCVAGDDVDTVFQGEGGPQDEVLVSELKLRSVGLYPSSVSDAWESTGIPTAPSPRIKCERSLQLMMIC